MTVKIRWARVQRCRSPAPLAAVMLLLAGGCLSGCAELEALNRGAGLAGEGMDSSPQGQVSEVLAYVRYVDGLDMLDSQLKPALQNEYQTLERVVREHRQPVNRIKLAWLLALPETRFHDSKRSLELLQHVSGQLTPGPGPVHDLVGWMSGMISYQRELARKASKTRSRLRAAQSQSRELEIQNSLLQEQSTELQQKIDALTQIEAGIDDTNYP